MQFCLSLDPVDLDEITPDALQQHQFIQFINFMLLMSNADCQRVKNLSQCLS